MLTVKYGQRSNGEEEPTSHRREQNHVAGPFPFGRSVSGRVMAFPLPDHLPRRAAPQDISSTILTRIDAATSQTLNAKLARSWLADLDDNISSTKQRIRDRIQSDLPKFESQLVSSKSVHKRLQTLKADVDGLHEAVSNPETGLISTVTRRLAKHAALVQEAANASVYHEALLHLSKCQGRYTNLEALATAGKLPDAIHASEELNSLLNRGPTALERTKVIADFKRKVHAARASVEERLSGAYSRSVALSRHKMLICPSIQVQNSKTVLPLSSILSSLSNESLNVHLSTLRRDLGAHFIDHVLKEPCSVVVDTEVSGQAELTCAPSPSNAEQHSLHLENLSTVLDFLNAHLFPHLPSSHWTSFSRSLRKALSNSILDNLLRPLLPSVFEMLPSYLSITKKAVEFEERYIVHLLSGDANDRAIRSWVDGLGGHYERQRRIQILDLSRTVILSPGGARDYFMEETELASEVTQSAAIPVQRFGPKDEDEDHGFSTDISEDAWGFEDEEKSGNMNSAAIDEDSWGFGDDSAEQEVEHLVAEDKPLSGAGNVEPDPGDAWGWNDDSDPPVEDFGEDSIWDDPWGEPASSDQLEESSVPEVCPPPAPSISQPKVASRLEKLASKSKNKTNISSEPSGSSRKQAVVSSAQSAPRSTQTTRRIEANRTDISKTIHGRPLQTKTTSVIRESYRVSRGMGDLVKLVEDVIAEGKHLSTSKLLPSLPSSPSLGTIILQTAPSTLDLFRALYPIKYGKELEQADMAMTFSNDCIYLSRQTERLMNGPAQNLTVLEVKFQECKAYFKVLGESWYSDAIEQQKQRMDKILGDGAQGFAYSSDQDRYDECEAAVNLVLREIRYLANKWKSLLQKSKYYSAIGSVTEAALSRILDDILALGDIPEVESHRLSELCRILNALEGLFVEDHNQVRIAEVNVNPG
ncbi:hypothetical protein AX15_003076 [Amanita polypyramis BW_CC]|nr:hypothetical protein AX15_003076 [Amanita polypyramis BW_CC]